MTILVLASFWTAIAAAATVISVVPRAMRLALAIRAVDYPGGRRLQKEAIPRLGGIAISAGIAGGVGLPILLLWREWGVDILAPDLIALVLGTLLILIVGLIDDVIGLSPIQRFLPQVAAAVGVVCTGWSFERLFVPVVGEVELGVYGVLLTLLWIVGVTNAINLLDGLDGLAGGVAAIIATSLLVFALIQGNILTVILLAAIVGSCLGFLRHNWAPARIYMGDSGSLTLGFLLAVMSVHSSIKGAATVAILVPILALGLPVIDTLLVMAVRFVEKPQGSHVKRLARMFQADRNHLHHLMGRAAMDRRQIVLVIYFIAACFCLMALLVAVSRSAELGTGLLVVEVFVVLLMRNLGFRRQARVIALTQRRQIREGFFSRR